MGANKVRVETNERIDLEDFRFLTDHAQENQEQLMSSLWTDPDKVRKWIIDGFEMSNPAAKQLQVTRGRAILAHRVDGVVQYGALAVEGDATITVDLNSYSPGTYGVYIRFEFVAGDFASRIKWNPAGNGSEYAETIATRYQAKWGVRVESTNPGDEWLYIGDVVQATMAITDKRELFFEGNVYDAGSGTYLSGWSTEGGGIANDRNADRQQYGVKDLQTFVAATRQCLEDIKGRGIRNWYSKGIGGLNIGFDTDPTEDVLAIADINFRLVGSPTDPQFAFDDKDGYIYHRSTNSLDFYINDVQLYLWDSSEYTIRHASQPTLKFNCTGAGADQKLWRIFTDSNEFSFITWNDADDFSVKWFNAIRSGTAISSVRISATTAAGDIALQAPRVGLGTLNIKGVDSVEVGYDLLPDTATIDIGATGDRFDNLFINDVDVTNDVTMRQLNLDGDAGSGAAGEVGITNSYNLTGGTVPGAFTASIKVYVNGGTKYLYCFDSAT